MPKVSDILANAKAGKLSIATCTQVLRDSEGAKGGAKAVGHVLQHVFDADGSVRKGQPLKAKHFNRGPKIIEGKVDEGFNSFFKSLEQAAAYLKTILESKSGINSLELLSASDNVISLWYGVTSKDQYYKGTLQELSLTPTNDNYYTYWEDSIRSIVLRLHHRSGDELHVQSMYPTDKAFPAGAGQLIVRPDDKANPSPHKYCVLA